MPLGHNDRHALLEAYKTLPTFMVVEEGLAQLKRSGFWLFAFSNGTTVAVEARSRDHCLEVVID